MAWEFDLEIKIADTPRVSLSLKFLEGDFLKKFLEGGPERERFPIHQVLFRVPPW